MDTELVQKLSTAGFPLHAVDPDDPPFSHPMRQIHYITDDLTVYEPSLEELIEASGDRFAVLSMILSDGSWQALGWAQENGPLPEGIGSSPKNAVARLWIICDSLLDE